MATVTIKLADNPLAGQDAQPDYILTISSDPDVDLVNGELPPVESLTSAQMAAVACVAHIAGLSYEASFVRIASGSQN